TARCWRTSPCTTRPGLRRWPRRPRAPWRPEGRLSTDDSGFRAAIRPAHVGKGASPSPFVFAKGQGSMSEIQSLSARALDDIAAAQTPDALEALRIGLLGKQGSITAQLKQLGALPAEQRKAAGEAINRVRDAVAQALAARREVLEDAALDARLAGEAIDPTLPGRNAQRGGIHPISRTLERIAEIFGRLGY